MKKVIFCNGAVLVLWGLCLTVLILLSCVAWLTAHDGEASMPGFAVLCVLGLSGVACAYYLSGHPCCVVSKDTQGDITFTWLYPYKRIQKTFAAAHIPEPVISEKVDSDGDSHFTAYINLPDGSEFILRQSIVVTGSGGTNGRHKQRCERACQRFLDLIAEE